MASGLVGTEIRSTVSPAGQEMIDDVTHHSLRLPRRREQTVKKTSADRKTGSDKKRTARQKPDGPFRASAREAYASVRTLVTFGSTVMPGPNVVATVAFWM
ncbi:hypothetical protein GCM10010052_05290 [Paenarthrobacter histidinolovorans]|nr:hypothetical protein GCM10010052_05290 [Paenarthrobacter histidinolovorans]